MTDIYTGNEGMSDTRVFLFVFVRHCTVLCSDSFYFSVVQDASHTDLCRSILWAPGEG